MNIKRKIFESILDRIERWKTTPTRADIQAEFCGLTDDVDLHLEQLECEGLLHLSKDGSGKILLLPTFHLPRQIGVLGGGFPSGKALVDETSFPGSITLDLKGVGISMPRDLYAIPVLDDSMADAGLKCGDLAILTNFAARPGDIVAVDTGNRMILRRYLVIAEIPHFLAENPEHPDLRLAVGVPIHGVLWSSIHTEQRRPVPSPGQRSKRTATKPPVKQTGAAGKYSGEKEPPSEWPEPPSGIHLNDVPTTRYHSTTWLHTSSP